MKKTFVSLLTLMLAVSMTACAPAGTPTGTDSNTSAKTNTASNSANAGADGEETVEIRFANWDGGVALEAYDQAINAFMAEHPNIKVTNLNIPSEYDTKMTAMVAANDIPEVAIQESGTLLYPLAEEGKIINLLDLMNADPSFDQSKLIDNLKYMKDPTFMAGYGCGAENITMFYNPSLFQKYGVEEPPAKYADSWDWNTFVENAKKLTIDKNGKSALDAGFDPNNIDVYGVNIGKWWATWIPFVKSAGSDYLNEDGTAIGMDSPEAVDAMQKLADLIWVHHVSPTPTSSQTMPGLSEAMATNKVAMSIDGQWSNAGLMEDGVEYNVAALPKIGSESKTVITCGCLSIMDTPKKDAAWEFFKFMTTPGAVAPLEKSGLWLPVTQEGYSEEYLKEMIGDNHPSNYYDTICLPMLDGTADTPLTGWVVNFNKINDIINPALDPVWAGEASYEDAIKTVVNQANAEVKGRRDK